MPRKPKNLNNITDKNGNGREKEREEERERVSEKSVDKKSPTVKPCLVLCTHTLF